MNESIFKATLRRFFLVLASVLGAICALLIITTATSLLLDKDVAGRTEVKHDLTAEIQPNAQGIREALSKTSPVILKINIEGVIGIDKLTRDHIAQQLIESREAPFADNRVKAILLAINSPGGTVTDSDSIYRAIKAYKEKYKVPVYAHVDGLCASGGLYIACSADKIFATDTSIVGSVGVVTPPIFNVVNLMNKIGVESVTLSAGKGKDELNPFRPWEKDEGENYKNLIDYMYELFVNVVTSNRKNVDRQLLISEYGAHIFNAAKAQEIGFIDGSTMSYNDTLKLLVKEIGALEDEYQVVQLSDHNWFDSLFKSESPLGILSGTVHVKVELPGMLDPKFASQYLYMHQ